MQGSNDRMTDRWKCLVSRPKTALLSHISLKTTEYTDSGANFRLILPQYKESSPAPFSRGKAKIALFPKRKLANALFFFRGHYRPYFEPHPQMRDFLSLWRVFVIIIARMRHFKRRRILNMPLLKAALNLDPNPAREAGIMTCRWRCCAFAGHRSVRDYCGY